MSMRRPALAAAVAGGLALSLGVTTGSPASPAERRPGSPPRSLDHVGTFFLQENLRPGEAEQATSAEIIAFTKDRRTLLYTDALTARLGFVDTSDVRRPRPDGSIDLPGDPTSVAVVGNRALVSVVTSEDPDGDGPLNELDDPSGDLLVVDLRSRDVVRTIELAGQPDSIAVAPSGDHAAIVIENERDEDEDDGLIPQPPAGLLQILDLDGAPGRWSLRDVDLTGLAEVAPDDPEPEYVDINDRDRAVVSMQENNHLVVVNLRNGRVVSDFSAGTVDVRRVDTTEEEIGPDGAGDITLDGRLDDRRREPDSVHWVDRDTFATANEGDYTDAEGVEGGSRSFTLFNADGTVEYEAGNRFEHEVVRAGHYPEARSENKGVEPEGLEVGTIRGVTYLFVGSERANVVGVYAMRNGRPRFQQLLPTGIGPEGLVLSGGVLAVSAETDGFDDGFAARPFITFFRTQSGAQRGAQSGTQSGAPSYPMIESADVAGLPVPWVAQSGLAGHPTRRNVLWSVSDSYLGQAYLYRIDAARHPARITKRIPVGGTDVADPTTGDFDLEGVAARPEGGFWLASEGAVGTRPNLVLRVSRKGAVRKAVELPPELADQMTSSGFEGVTVTGSAEVGDEAVYVAVQREWADDAPGFVKIGRYDVAGATWSFASYPLDAVESPAGGWVGLSELTALPSGRLLVVERDNQLGLEARVKRLYRIDPASVDFAPYGEQLPVLRKRQVRDLLPQLDAASISVPDKVEGFARTADGRRWMVTDNDGVDENYGETVFTRVR
jgi:hypothetical protein